MVTKYCNLILLQDFSYGELEQIVETSITRPFLLVHQYKSFLDVSDISFNEK